MTRVLVVDDHPVVRAGIVALLGTRPGIEVVAQAGTAAEALSAFGRERPDVVLMDLQLGADDGVTTTRTLRALDPQARVLILTTYDTDADIVNAIEAGAVGYLLKDASPDALGAAVESAARGETVFAPAVAGRLARRVVAPPDELTEREREVIAQLAQGLTNRQIAKQLFLSEATVKTHLVHIFTKLAVDNRTAAVAAAREQGLLR